MIILSTKCMSWFGSTSAYGVGDCQAHRATTIISACIILTKTVDGCGLSPPKVELDQKGDDTTIFGILEKVHERPTCHLGAGDGGPLLPVYFASQGVEQPGSKSAVHSFYPKPCLRPTKASRHCRWQCKRERSRREERYC